MANFILIGICILAGVLFRRYGQLPVDAHKGINSFIIYVALPAVSFKYLPHIQWSRSLLLPVMGPLVVWLGGWVYAHFYARANALPGPTRGGLKLTAGLSNTSFIGFPLIVAWFGEQQLSTGVICDQVTFILLSTAGIMVAMNSSENHKLKFSLLAKRLLLFPPFIGCVLALVLPHWISLDPLAPLFSKLAATVGPLALFSIGLQLRFDGWRRELRPTGLTLLYKLALAPLLVVILAMVLGMKGDVARVTVFEAAMPTLLSAGIIADQYELDSKLVNLVTGIGIVISFATTAGWWWLLQRLL